MRSHTGLLQRRRVSVGADLTRAAGRDSGRARERDGSRHRLRPALVLLEDRCLMSGVFTVTSIADSAPASNPTMGTLRWAVQQADASTTGATINFNLTTPATITLAQGPLDLGNQAGAVMINGPGAGLLTVSGGGASQVFTLDMVPQGNAQTVSMSGLTITGGSTTGSGAGLFSRGFMILTGVNITNNAAGVDGGGVDNIGHMTLVNCTLSGNSATSDGGGFYNSGTATLIDCNIANNTTGTTGISGGCGLDNIKGATLSLTGCTVSGNSSASLGLGAGLLNYGTANLADCTISANTAKTSGSGSQGGGLDNTGTGIANLTDCTLTGNFANIGGGLDNFINATVNLTDCTVSSNTAAYSAGVNSLGPITLTDCTISGNTATGGGGGMGVGPGATSLTNCTISGNSAAYGGGLLNYAQATLTDCTISGNTAPTGAGIDNQSASGYTIAATLTDTIVAGNMTPGAVASDIGGPNPAGVTGTYNLIGTGGSGGIVGGTSGNLVGVANPGLAALANNGGLTQTMALMTGTGGSPALNAGVVVSGVGTDERGLPRPSGSIDIGAFQVPAVPDSPPIAAYQAVSTNENASFSGQISASDTDNNALTYSVVTGPADGVLDLQSTGAFTYIPNTKYYGPDSFTFQAFDGIAYSNVATVAIVVYPVNLQPPVAVNQSYATAQNTALSIGAPGVLTNDTDPNNLALTAVLVGGPVHGALTLNSNGSFTYVPATGYYGTDTFTYEAYDGQLDSSPATVALTVGTPPVANNDAYSVVPNSGLMAGEGPTYVTMVSQPGDFVGQGQSYTFGGTITAQVLTSGVYANTVEIDITYNSQFWTLDFAAPNQAQLVVGTYNNATRWPFQAAGVPGLDVSGDGRGSNTLTGSFTVTQAVYGPSGNIVSFVASFVQYGDGSKASLSGQVYFNDTLGQPSGVLANDIDTIAGTTLTAALVSGPSHGTLAFNPNGSFSYIPTGNFVGVDSFTYQDSVGTLVSNVATVTITVDQAPVANNDGYSTKENSSLSVVTPGVLGNDVDFTTLPLSAIVVANPAHGAVTLNANGSFSYTPAANFFGTDSFTYQDTDGIVTSNTATVTITVTQGAQATFLKEDTTTAGNWMGTYGSQGYDVINSGASGIKLPANVTVTPAHEALYTWANPAPPTATQALEVPPGGTSRIAACWYLLTSFTVDVNVASGSYNLELYVLDYDNQKRSEQIQLSDAGTGTVLSTETVSGFSGGAYLNWTISGNVLITITKLTGPNAILSGLFFDPTVAPVSTVTGVGSSLNPSIYGQAVTFTATVSDTGSAVPLGSVEFFDGTTDLGHGSALAGSGESATSTFTTSTLAAGTHGSITAVYTPLGNFVGSSGSVSQTVTTRVLTVAATGVNKVYDGTTTATVTLSDNRVNGDTFTDTYTSAVFVTKNAGTGETVNVSGISISGPGASNYTFNITATTSANITAAPLTLTAQTNTKVYDGTTSAAAVPLVTGLKGSDSVTNLTETYATPTVGTGKTLNVSTYTVNDGNSGNNYVVALVANNNGVITGATAVFLKEDTTTAGNWMGTYGSQGYDVINSGASGIKLPANVTVTPAHEALYTWANPAPPTATQALEVPPGGTSRIAACWYLLTSFTVDVNVASGSYNLELYVLDYDNQKRSEQIQLSDAGTGTVLSTETVSGFSGGAYLNWTISGNVLITITKQAGPNAVLSGLFFDPPSSSPGVIVDGGGLLGTGIGASGQVATDQSTAIAPLSFPSSSAETLAAGGTELAGRRTTGTIVEKGDDMAEVSASSFAPVAPPAAGTSVSSRELVNDLALELVTTGNPWTRARFAF